MGKNKFLFRSIIVVSILLSFSSIAFALPTIQLADDQTFDQNQTYTQLKNITITEDSASTFIKQGSIKISIPDSIKIIFDTTHTKNQILLYGTAVTHGKIAENPIVIFENNDKTLVIPVNEDFDPGENIIITRVFVEGFNESPSNSSHLSLQINNEQTQYLDGRNLYIQTSSIEDYNSPDMPTNVSLEDNENGGVRIAWKDPTDLDLQSIEILKGKNNDPVSGIVHTTVMAGLQEYIDTDAAEGETVKYVLRSKDGKNLSLNTSEYSFVVGSSVEEATPEEVTPVEDSDQSADMATDTISSPEEPTFCTLDYAPVCGIDGIAYTNECAATKEPVGIAHEGECTAEEAAVVEVVEQSTEPKVENIEVNFTDTENHWAISEITKMASRGIVKGQSEGVFNPNGNLNRAEAAALLYRILGLEEPTAPSEMPFSDVETDKWYAGYISSLKDLKMVNGNPEGTYAPEKEINRAEFLSLAMNLYYYTATEEEKSAIDLLKEGEQTTAYIDLKSDWYTTLVTAATEKKFIGGKTCGEFKCFEAENNITRAEATVILFNIFKDYLNIAEEEAA